MARMDEIKKATVCGGGTKSREWMQVLSDVLGIELDIIENEGPAMGAALLAAGNGVYDVPLRIKYTVEPDKSSAEIYNNKYGKFKLLYPLLKPFYCRSLEGNAAAKPTDEV